MSEKKRRKSYTPAFKAKIGLEALKGEKTINEIGQEHGVHPAQVGQWKRAIQEQPVGWADAGSPTYALKASAVPMASASPFHTGLLMRPFPPGRSMLSTWPRKRWAGVSGTNTMRSGSQKSGGHMASQRPNIEIERGVPQVDIVLLLCVPPFHCSTTGERVGI